MTGGMEILETVLAGLPGGPAIDVATGVGNFARAVLQCSNHTELIVAGDSSMGGLLRLNEAKTDGILPAGLDAMALPFADDTFNTASISNSLHHMEDPEGVLREMMRVLKPGGALVLREMFTGGNQTPAQNTHNIMHNWWGRVDSQKGVTHNPVYTRKELEELFRSSQADNCSFHSFEVLDTNPFDPGTEEQIEKAWKTYMARAEGNDELKNAGEKALQHFREHGFSGARALVATGLKPRPGQVHRSSGGSQLPLGRE